MKFLHAILFSLCLTLPGTVPGQSVPSDADSSLTFAQKPPEALMKDISLHLKNVPFDSALQIISEKTDCLFNYSRRRIPVDRKIDLDFRGKAWDALNLLLEKTNTELRITSEGQIVILPAKFKKPRKGTIKGQVLDKETRAPLQGANVMVAGSGRGSASDASGIFEIGNLDVGSYTVQCTYMGYKPVKLPDIIIRSERTTFFPVEMEMTAIQGKNITVSAGYFPGSQDQPVSLVSFKSEEIRRAPGAAGDVSRILMGLPSIAKVNDQANSLIVRGGSPMENGFFVDNIEIPNINHFPEQGSSGGPIGMVNVDFISNVDFYTGGFSARYGDRLSSVMDLRFREGNRDEFDGQLDLNFSGFGIGLEGPLPGNGSVLFSARRSFLDLLVDAIGTGVAPRYGDYQGKIVYDLNPKHKLTVLGIFGDDKIGVTRKEASDQGNPVFGDDHISTGSFGMNWQALWNQHGVSNTSVSFSRQKYSTLYSETKSDALLLNNRSEESGLKLRNVNHLRLNPDHALEFGTEIKYLSTNYNNFYGVFTSALGDTTPEMRIKNAYDGTMLSGFLDWQMRDLRGFSLSAGVRGDHFTFNNSTTWSPRIAIKYQINDRLSVNASAGTFYQNLPMVLMAQKPEYKNLKNPESTHMILGLDYLITESTRLSLEVYQKNYRHFPMDPQEPGLFILDELFYRYGFFFNHDQLDDLGKARSRGIELLIQKKLARDFYGMISSAYFRSEYTDFDGIVRNRSFDNRILFNIEGGYKPNSKWEFSLRWVYAGGAPYTPIDLQKSLDINRETLDETRINAERFPSYHSLNLRFDRRYHFTRTNLVFYFSVWNAYNRKNVSSYRWNETKMEQEISYQWSLLPVFGLEYEF